MLAEARVEAKVFKLEKQLNRLKDRLERRERIKGFKKIKPLTANTYEARLNKQYRAYMVFEKDKVIIFQVGDHLKS